MRPFRGILCLTAILGATFVVALAGNGWGWGAQRPPAAPEVIAPPAAETQAAQASFRMIGARSCAATACHGSVHRDPRSLGAQASHIRRDEYVVWSDQDPHARSLTTLENDRSQQIFAELRITDGDGKVVDQRAYNNCLACHATKVTAPVTGAVSYESVSCEACHGPAQAWRETHFQRHWNPQLAARSGFAQTKSLPVRAMQCVQCHVGADDREVNHDLIAAGHPVLKFELAAYHELLPKHWNDAAERRADPGFEGALWKAGQVATISSTLELTAARVARRSSAAAAADAPVAPVWPEFAEYDCFACHHDLVDTSWYRPQDKPPQVLAAWNTWNLANVLPGASKLDELRELMPRQMRGADEDLLAKLNAARLSDPTEWLPSGSAAPVADASRHWDSAAQAYLQLAARFRQRQDEARAAGQPWPQQAVVKQTLLALRRNLAFDKQHDSPGAHKAGLRDEIAKQLQTVEQHLSQGGR